MSCYEDEGNTDTHSRPYICTAATNQTSHLLSMMKRGISYYHQRGIWHDTSNTTNSLLPPKFLSSSMHGLLPPDPCSHTLGDKILQIINLI
uniref:Uncharacterized protein n=1 Tax=Arundo donax TaxID=35708 RepID=A0A0A9EQI6_ARUDO